jgi:hypothetical protein
LINNIGFSGEETAFPILSGVKRAAERAAVHTEAKVEIFQ